MTDPIKAMYKAARKDKEFKEAQEYCDKGYKMPWLADRHTQQLYSSAYGGFLMAKHGAVVAQQIFENIKS